MSTLNTLEIPVYKQTDLTAVEPVKSDDIATVYKATQLKEGFESKEQTVRFLPDIHNHYALKREKDLLHYFNQFEKDFPRFNEIRKVGFGYLQFFDFVGKKTLQSKAKKKAGLSSQEAKTLLANMVSSLKAAHGVGFVHSMIRPENIVYGNKRFYLVNWSQSIPSRHSYETELMTGDKKYCPPERMQGEYGDAGDIYALGCTLYFALTGKHIFKLNKVNNEFDCLYAHAFHTPRKLNMLPHFWRELIVWMTQKDPEKRPGLVNLEDWLKNETVPKAIRQQEREIVKDFPEDSLTALADSHFLYAQYKKATLYEASGNLETAFNLYESCAFKGYTRAENSLGHLYEQGVPVRQSYLKAMKMYHHAYQKGNPVSAFHLGKLFENGLGMNANLIQAFKLYEFAALRGHLPAQNQLGYCYWKGIGVQSDLIQARFWFGMAAYYGDNSAAENIKGLLKDSQ